MEQTVFDIASNTWGPHPSSWPCPPLWMPRWWQFKRKKKLTELEAVFGRIDDAALDRYWEECALGQSVHEDAGGYILRCYRALLGEEVEKPYTYEEAIQDAARRTP